MTIQRFLIAFAAAGAAAGCATDGTGTAGSPPRIGTTKDCSSGICSIVVTIRDDGASCTVDRLDPDTLNVKIKKPHQPNLIRWVFTGSQDGSFRFPDSGIEFKRSSSADPASVFKHCGTVAGGKWYQCDNLLEPGTYHYTVRATRLNGARCADKDPAIINE